MCQTLRPCHWALRHKLPQRLGPDLREYETQCLKRGRARSESRGLVKVLATLCITDQGFHDGNANWAKFSLLLQTTNIKLSWIPLLWRVQDGRAKGEPDRVFFSPFSRLERLRRPPPPHTHNLLGLCHTHAVLDRWRAAASFLVQDSTMNSTLGKGCT